MRGGLLNCSRHATQVRDGGGARCHIPRVDWLLAEPMCSTCRSNETHAAVLTSSHDVRDEGIDALAEGVRLLLGNVVSRVGHQSAMEGFAERPELVR